MKSNRIITIFSTIILLFNSFGYAQTKLSDEIQIKKRLNDFYICYIKENSKTIGNTKTIDAIQKKYCTEKLLNKIKNDELDYDPILNAQDCDILWLKTLKILKDSKMKDLYFVTYIDTFSKKKNTIKLIVIKEDGNFKINEIID
jgi:hypothetical protein